MNIEEALEILDNPRHFHYDIDISGGSEAIETLLDFVRSTQWQPMNKCPENQTVMLKIKYSDVPLIGKVREGRVSANTEHYETFCGTWCDGGTPTTCGGTEAIGWKPY